MSPGRKKGRGKTGSAQATGKAGTEAIRAADSQAGPARKVRSGGARNARTKTAEALASKVRKPARRKTPAEQSAVAAPESTRRETRAAGSRAQRPAVEVEPPDAGAGVGPTDQGSAAERAGLVVPAVSGGCLPAVGAYDWTGLGKAVLEILLEPQPGAIDRPLPARRLTEPCRDGRSIEDEVQDRVSNCYEMVLMGVLELRPVSELAKELAEVVRKRWRTAIHRERRRARLVDRHARTLTSLDMLEVIASREHFGKLIERLWDDLADLPEGRLLIELVFKKHVPWKSSQELMKRLGFTSTYQVELLKRRVRRRMTKILTDLSK